MLGRGVARRLAKDPVRSLFGADLLEVLAATDGMLLNLECCLSDRGEPWPGRVFHFRGPPPAAEALRLLGVRAVTLANNHALDFGPDALLDTLAALGAAGIVAAGAGPDRALARAPALLTVGSLRLAVVSVTDDPEEYAARSHRPGVAHAALQESTPAWLTSQVHELATAGTPVLVSPHWGPNMTTGPLPYVRRAAADLVAAGAAVVAGHSAHVFHGVQGPVLFDLGDFLDDYATDPQLRNDLSLLWLLSLDARGRPVGLEAVPLRLECCHTRLASPAEAQWIGERLRRACRALGTEVVTDGERFRVRLTPALSPPA